MKIKNKKISFKFEENILKIIFIFLLSIYIQFLIKSNFIFYSNDGNETLGTLLHAENNIQFGRINNYLTDESTGTSSSQHPLIHVSQGNWPRIPVLILKSIGISDFYTVFIILTISFIFNFYTITKILKNKINNLYASIFTIIFFLNYLHVMQWHLNLYRVWQINIFFLILLIIFKYENQNKNRYLIYFSISIAILLYGELIYAIWLTITIFFFIILKFYVLSTKNIIKLISSYLIGIFIGFGTLVFQLISLFEPQQIFEYFLNINRIRNGDLKVLSQIDLISTKKIIFWENYGLTNIDLGDYSVQILKNLSTLISYSYGLNFIIPIMAIFAINTFSKFNKFSRFAFFLCLIIFLLGETNNWKLVLGAVFIYLIARNIFEIKNTVIDVSIKIFILVLSTFQLSFPSYTDTKLLIPYLDKYSVTLILFVLFLSILFFSKINFSSLISIYRLISFKNLIFYLIILNITQKFLSKFISYFYFYTLSSLELLFFVIFIILYFIMLIYIPKIKIKNNLQILKFIISPIIGLFIVSILSPGYVLTGYLYREDLLWKGLIISIITYTIYNVIWYFQNNLRKTLWIFKISQFSLIGLYLFIQIQIAQIQPSNSIAELSNFLERKRQNLVLYSNTYPPLISYSTNNYSNLIPLNEIRNLSDKNTLKKYITFPDYSFSKYSNFYSYLFLDVTINFDKTITRHVESGGNPMPAENYCSIIFENFASTQMSTPIQFIKGEFGKIGRYGYWCEFKVL